MTQRFLFTFCIVFFFCFTAENLLGASQGATEEENTLYENAIAQRNHAQELLKISDKKNEAISALQRAMDFFKPLAEKRFAKAEHNYAHCAFLKGDMQTAFRFFQRARDQGLEQSGRNLSRIPTMSLFDIGTLIDIAQLLDIKSLFALRETSLSMRYISEAALPYMNFLSKDGEILLPFFSKVTFTPAPSAAMVEKRIEATGDVTIHFRDVLHLKRLARKYPVIDCDNLFFEHNPSVLDNKELIFHGQENRSLFMIHVIADCDETTVTGVMNCPYNTHLPRGCSLNRDFLHSGPSLEWGGKLETKEKAFALAEMLHHMGDQLIIDQTKEARERLAAKKLHRQQNPDIYPPFDALHDANIFAYPLNMEATPLDDFMPEHEGFLTYISASRENIVGLLDDLPSRFSKSHRIFLVNSQSSQNGIFTRGRLDLCEGFKIKSARDLYTLDRVHFPHHNILIEATNLGIFGDFIANSLTIRADYVGVLTFTGRNPSVNFASPSWTAFLGFLVEGGRLRRGGARVFSLLPPGGAPSPSWQELGV